MSKLFFILLYILSACGSHYDKPAEVADILRAEYAKRVKEFDIWSIERCDRLTFAALYDAFGSHIDLYQFEGPSGQWHRDVKPCYVAGEIDDSRSETSRDAYLSLAFALYGRRDANGAKRILDFAKPLGWITGQGDSSVTSIWPLVGLYQTLSGLGSLSESEDEVEALAGFRGHLAAMYIWARARLNGKMNELELQTLRALVENSPDNPLFQAIYHRYSDGKQERAEQLLLSWPRGVAYSGWGSAPDDIVFMVAYRAIGKI